MLVIPPGQAYRSSASAAVLHLTQGVRHEETSARRCRIAARSRRHWMRNPLVRDSVDDRLRVRPLDRRAVRQVLLSLAYQGGGTTPAARPDPISCRRPSRFFRCPRVAAKTPSGTSREAPPPSTRAGTREAVAIRPTGSWSLLDPTHHPARGSATARASFLTKLSNLYSELRAPRARVTGPGTRRAVEATERDVLKRNLNLLNFTH